jgi:hypothetical protein
VSRCAAPVCQRYLSRSRSFSRTLRSRSMLRTYHAFMHALLRSEHVSDSPIAHRRAAWLSRLPSFRFEQRISGQRHTHSKGQLDRRVQQEILNCVYDSMFHFVGLPNAIITTVRTKRNAASGVVGHKSVELAAAVYDRATSSDIQDALSIVGRQLLPTVLPRPS